MKCRRSRPKTKKHHFHFSPLSLFHPLLSSSAFPCKTRSSGATVGKNTNPNPNQNHTKPYPIPNHHKPQPHYAMLHLTPLSPLPPPLPLLSLLRHCNKNLSFPSSTYSRYLFFSFISPLSLSHYQGFAYLFLKNVFFFIFFSLFWVPFFRWG